MNRDKAIEALKQICDAVIILGGTKEEWSLLRLKSAERAIAALTDEQPWKNAGEISDAAKKRYDELSYKEWDWRSFHNGFLEGAEATLQRGRDETGALRKVGPAVLASDTDAHGIDLSGLSEEMATQVRLYKASGGTDVAGYILSLTGATDEQPQKVEGEDDVRDIDDSVIAFIDQLTDGHDINPMIIGLWYQKLQLFINRRLAEQTPEPSRVVVSEPIGWTWTFAGDRHFRSGPLKPAFSIKDVPDLAPVYTAPKPTAEIEGWITAQDLARTHHDTIFREGDFDKLGSFAQQRIIEDAKKYLDAISHLQEAKHGQ